MGFSTSDDAGVYRLTDDLALITTADFITPPVDDPYIYGQIAAANALSDVYAMGGRPITCLNLLAFPSRKLAPEMLHQIVAGALSKITEAGAVLAGGHSIEDDEPKFGLAVNGLVHPQRYWTNVGAYVIPGEKNDTQTMLDAVVYDIPSRKIVINSSKFSSGIASISVAI